MTAPRPNTFIVGAPRCGTTAWVSYLASHPDVVFSHQKEPHYFCTDFEGFRWARTPDAYQAQFAGLPKRPVVAEASVQYLYSRVAAARIRAFAPDARILIFLRRQRTFLPSYHMQLTYNGDETLTAFEEAWRLARMGARTVPRRCREASFLDYPAVGRFDEQVARFAEAFPPEQILVMRYEDWTKAPRATYLKVLDFLGLEDDGRAEFPRLHGAKQHRMSALARLTQRPPAWALDLAATLRGATGRRRLGWAGALRQMNGRAGYARPLATSLLEEIDSYYSESNARLQGVISGMQVA